jgi:hypothetical protein
MGVTYKKLAARSFSTNQIFKNRFVVEICEKVHTHYRNVRFINSIQDWVNVAQGYADALNRWKVRGCPGTSKVHHIELCRKQIINENDISTCEINLNHNLYVKHEGEIFSEGADFTEPYYIHLKLRDVRIELSIEDFKTLSEAIKDAERELNSCDNVTGVSAS